MSLTTNKLRTLLANGGVNLSSDTLKAVLVTSGYTPNADHNFLDSITASTSKELSGTGYTAGFGGSGRKTLASVTVTQDDTNDLAVFDAADLTWTAINAGTVAYVAIVKEITDDAHSPILAVLSLSPAVTTNGGDLTIQFSASGLITFA